MTLLRQRARSTHLARWRLHLGFPQWATTRSAAFCLAGVLLLVACGGDDKAKGSGAAPGPTAKTPESVAATKADVPDDLGRCAYSGLISSYINALGQIDVEAQEANQARWTALQAEGATDAYVSVHTGLPVACRVLASGSAAGHGHAHFRRSVSATVAQFNHDAAAAAVYTSDLSRPSPLSQMKDLPGAETGTATGLGPNSTVWSNEATWTEEDPGPKAYVAVWQNGPFYMSVKTENITRAEAHAAALAQHRRAA